MRFGGTRDDTNGRVAEVGIVLPLVPPQPDPVLNGGEGGGAGAGDKRSKNDAGKLKLCSLVHLLNTSFNTGRWRQPTWK